MRSGFLNSSSSDAPSSSSEKGSRNKRKFRTDHHPQSPVPTSACVHNNENDKNRTVCDGNVCSSTTKDTYNADAAAAPSPAINRCCSYSQHIMLPNHPSYHTGLPIMDCRSHSCDIHMGLRHIPYSKHDKSNPELLGSDWDQLSEAQLEEILMNTLDSVYKDAIKKIILYDYSHDDALNAVLKNGRCNGRDALASIVDSSLAWLKNKEAKTSPGDPVFSDLKQLESYVLAEMISMLRKVRPYMSKGDAMWFLLMCDLNVFLAYTTEEDAFTSSNVKDGTIPNVVLPQSTASVNANLPLPTALPTVASMPSPEQIPVPGNAQTSTVLMSSNKDNRSAFSTPNFSSSPVGKVAIASRKGLSKSSGSKGMHSPISTINREGANSNQGSNTSHSVAVSNPYHLSLPQAPALEKHTTNFGLSFSQGSKKFEYVDKAHKWQPDNIVSTVSSPDALIRTVQFSCAQSMPQCLDIALNPSSALSAQTPILNDSCQMRAVNTVYSNSQVQSTDDQSAQIELQMGRTLTTFSTVEGVLGAELSLKASSPVNNVGKEVTGNTQVNDGISETLLTQTDHNSSASRLPGSNDAEKREAVMLWPLMEHVKYLDAQLQLWTDWAQQKVMQAARRLTKDSAELKALRQERDEYLRLKKEKQTLEESTMKKLAEMENALRKAVSQIDRANSTAWRLEAENAELRAEMEAAKLAAAMSISECDKASKREEMSVKKVQGWEKQKLKLQEDLLNGSRTLSNLLEQLSLAKERFQQTEAKWRQEKTAKEEALLQFEIEKKAKEELDQSSKRRMETLQLKCDAESQDRHDELKKLEKEIIAMKLSLGLQPSPLSWENGLSHTLNTYSMDKLKQIHAKLLSEVTDLDQEVHRDWECVMCMNEEISVVFLPCAHQIVCVKCNELHQKQGLRECPSCRTPIQRRIRVYGARS